MAGEEAAAKAEPAASAQSDVAAPFARRRVASWLTGRVNNKINKLSDAFDYACRVAKPYSNSFVDQQQGERPYLGRAAELVGMFGNRVGMSAIRNWRYGLRRPPGWAIDVVCGELRRLENRAREARERLERDGPRGV